MNNIRGHKVIIEREYAYYFALLFWFVLGATVGASGMRLYYMIDNYLSTEPIGYLCKQGIVYEQADPISTVYLKTDQQCIEEKV